MKLLQFIAAMPELQRKEIARVWGGTELEETTLTAWMKSPDAIRAWHQALYETERRTLRLIVQSFGCEPFDWAQLERCGMREMAGAALKVGLLRLIRLGIVFSLRKSWGEAMYALPEDTFGEWRQLFYPFEPDAFTYEGTEVESETPEVPGLANAILTAASYAAKHELSITQKGTLHKRHAQRLAAELNVEESCFLEIAHLASTEKYGSTGVAFTFATAGGLELIHPEGDKLQVNPSRLRDWLDLNENERNSRLYEEWKRIAGPKEVKMRHAVECLELLPAESWISLDVLSDWLDRQAVSDCRTGKKQTEASFTERLLAQWLQPLAAWGWIELGAAPEGGSLMRWKRPVRGEAELRTDSTGAGTVFVQPDFELIATPDCPFLVRWELELIAERIRVEQLAVYRLTRESVMNAMEHGRKAEEIVDFLETFSKYKVPEHVREAVLQWGARRDQLRLEEVTLLRIRDEAAAKAIAEDPRLVPMIEEAVTPTLWIVRSSQVSELRAVLEKSGYHPGVQKNTENGERRYPKFDKGAEQTDRNEGKYSAKDWPNNNRLIYSQAPVKYYDKEGDFPSAEQIYPGLPDVPPMWLKECRAYHISTRKQIVQKALDWKACLRLRSSGSELLLIPFRIDGIRDDWAVTGFDRTEEVRLSPDQWEEMQLVLPGIND